MPYFLDNDGHVYNVHGAETDNRNGRYGCLFRHRERYAHAHIMFYHLYRKLSKN